MRQPVGKAAINERTGSRAIERGAIQEKLAQVNAAIQQTDRGDGVQRTPASLLRERADLEAKLAKLN